MHLRAGLATSLIFPLLLVGCSPATQITATSWEASPDGEWVTRVARYDTAGPGNNSVFEVVEMKRRSADKGADLLTIDEGGVLPDELNGSPVITLHWRDRTHLQIGYRAGEIDHQVVKVANVSVETRRLAVQR
jgi:hypothetical protein